MVAFPNCKINLGLHITQKRADGYHNIETVFYPIAFNDILEIIPTNSPNNVEYNSSGISISGNSADNLCVKAYHLLKKDFPKIPSIQMHLHKNIPMGAGLGGGSADGSFALKMMNQQFQLNLSDAQLIQYALLLGSDCPFFILNTACIGKGRGELLTPIELDFSSHKIQIINPGIHINTGWAFSQINPTQPILSIEQIIQQPIEAWKGKLTNDFEPPVCKQYPEIALLINQLYKANAVYAALSGSGSTVFALFKKSDPIQISVPDHYYTKLVD
jgi:4-diphosphocytidyl-2-C-methyl-D-erythritol kinase